MAKRSLQASAEGIARAKRVFDRRGWTQEYLAAEVGLQTRQSVWKFFSGRPVERHIFIELCFNLDLNWEDIAEPPGEPEEPSALPLTAAPMTGAGVLDLEEVRSHLLPFIQSQCRLLELPLELNHPITLPQIYTETSLYPRPFRGGTGLATAAPLSVAQAIQNHPRLLVLGGPGSGKTTLMQYLALETIEGRLAPDHLPIFLRLRQLALVGESFDLQTLVNQHWLASGLNQAQIDGLWQQSRPWLLLDGWDEVPLALQSMLTRQIQALLDRYPHLPLVITGRLGSVMPGLVGFTTLELAEFAPHQVEQFVQKWFQATDPAQGQSLAEACLQALRHPENERLRELTLTPILLHLVCLVFQGSGQFPMERSSLYQQALDLLLGRWDQQRGISRSAPLAELTTTDLVAILSHLAARTFEPGKVVFKKTELLTLIAQALLQRPSYGADPERRWADSQSILQVFVQHYGILSERLYETYAFSHLSFQEYFMARRLAITALDRDGSAAWQDLAAHLADSRWREVILLTVEMVPDATGLLQALQQQGQALLTQMPALDPILGWVARKADRPSRYQPATLQSFYLGLLLDHGLDLAIALDASLGLEQASDLALDRTLSQLLRQGERLLHHPTLQAGFDLCFAANLQQCFALPEAFSQVLEELQNELGEALEDQESLLAWTAHQGLAWLQRLRQACVEYRDLAPVGRLSEQQHQALEQYYQAQRLMVACLKRTPTPFEFTLLSSEVQYECRSI